MDTLKRQVLRAERRLLLQRILERLWRCWFVALLIAAVVVVVDKYHPMGVGLWTAFGGALVGGAVVALGWTWLTRRGSLEAAVEIDRRFGLKERVASSLSLEPQELETEAGQALVRDTLRRVEKVQISEQFRYRVDRWALMPLIPAAAVFLLALFLNPDIGPNEVNANTRAAAEKERVKQSTDVLRRKLVERRKKAEEQGLKDAEELFEKLEMGTKAMAEGSSADQKQALIKLNDLAQDLERRRSELGGADDLRDQLKQLGKPMAGPAEKMAQAMKQGDFAGAMEQLKQIREQMKAGAMDDEAKKQLAEQLGDLQKKIEEMADKHQQMQEELKRQIAEKRAAGDAEAANQLEKQLAKMAQQAPQMQQMQKLAEQMGQCAQCMKEGNAEGAQQALEELQAGLGDLQQQLDELQMLDEALDEIADAKGAMNCEMCDGAGCAACMGELPGQGLGEGQGQGDRPEEDGATSSYDTRVKQKQDQGQAVVVDYVEGPNRKGLVQQQIRERFDDAEAGRDADPVNSERLPRSYLDHTKGYFEALREGK